MKRKALVKFWFYDGWGSSHTEVYETTIAVKPDGRLTPTPPSPLRGWSKDRWELIKYLD